MTLPFVDPILIMAVAVTAFLVAPLIAARLGVPGLMVLIVIGAVVGPNATGLLARDTTMELLGTVGLLYLMFVAGLELDLRGFARERNRSLIFGALSFVIPAALAMAAMSAYRFELGPALLIGAIVASHTLLAYPIASRLGLAKNAAVTTVMGGTLLTDAGALLVLAAIDGAAAGDGGIGSWLRLGAGLSAVLALLVLGLPRAGAWFFRNTADDDAVRYLFLLAAAFGAAFAAQAAGAQGIIGAFLAGLLLNPLVPDASTLMTRVRFIGNALFVPFFLLSVGMLVDVRVLIGSADVAILAGLMIAVVIIGKGVAALIAQRIFGFSLDQGLLMVGLSVPQAAATLAVTFVGLEIGLFGEPVVNAVIVLILVSTLVGGTLTERFGRRVALTAEREAPAPEDHPHRILVPLANPATADDLLDLAFLMRAQDEVQPVFPTLVVPHADEVPRAERLLAHAVVHAAEADVPVTPLTRIARNPASGILAAARENRATDVVLGWSGRTPPGARLFGSVIDQTIQRCSQQVIVAHLKHPLATHRRLVVVLPALADHDPGFVDAARTIKRLASQLGTGLSVLAVKGDTTRLQARFGEVGPKVTADFAGLTEASAVLDPEAQWLDPKRDLLVLVAPRPGTVAHEPWLPRFARSLVGYDGAFLMLVPSEQALPGADGGPATRIRALLTRDRIVTDLAGASYSDAIERLLDVAVAGREIRRRQLLRKLLDDDVGYAAELLPGVVIAHARAAKVKDAALAVGVAAEGIEHRASAHQVHLLCLLVTPESASSREHLALLSDLSRVLTRVGGVDAVREVSDPDALRRWLLQDDDPDPTAAASSG